MENGYPGSTLPDAHVFIHESGHMCSLEDYYSTDPNMTFGPAGKLEVMDIGILDHSVYSKMLLEWTFPYVIDGSENTTTITLNPFESSGDCIIINDTWNGSPLDEYLAIEFYTPTGLNWRDSQPGGYPFAGLQGYTIPGIKIYHIDARGVRLAPDDSFDGYVTSSNDLSGGGRFAVGAANTPGPNSQTDSGGGPSGANYRLVHLMEATGTNSFRNGAPATNETLFTTGTSFTPSSTFFTKGTQFNNGSEVGYTIYIDTVTATSATIRVVKNV
jgi:hypothetical protein